MKRYALILVDQDYDHIEALEFHGLFSTREEAIAFTQSKVQEEKDKEKAYEEYARKFVENFSVPEYKSPHEWDVTCTKIFGGCNSGISPSNFKERLLKCIGRLENKPEGFNPPDRDWTFNRCPSFVLEIDLDSPRTVSKDTYRW